MGGHVDRVGNVEILERVRPSRGGGCFNSVIRAKVEFIIYDILPLRMQSCE